MSLERQEFDLRDYLEIQNTKRPTEKRLTILDWDADVFREEGSAKVVGRPIFNELLRLIEKGRYDAILATEPSRLSRNPLDTWRLIHFLDTEKLSSVVTLKGEFTTSYLDKFTFGLLLSISKYENDQRAANTQSGMAHIKALGGTTSPAPIGYRNVWTVKGAKHVERDGENFEKLQGLWRLLLTGKYSVTEIIKLWADSGISWVRKFWRENERRMIAGAWAYRGMFANRYYAWMVEQPSGEWIKGKHEAMVTNEEFDEVQWLLQKNGCKHSVFNPSYDNLLKGLLFCGHTGEPAYLDAKERYTCPRCKERSSVKGLKECRKCGLTVSPETWKIESRRYYSFSKGEPHTYIWNGETKTAKNIPAEFIESLVEAELSKISISDGLFDVLRKRMRTEWVDQKKSLKQKEEWILRSIKELESKKDNVLEEFSEAPNKASREKLWKMSEEYESQILGKRQELADLNDKMEEEFERAWELLNALLETKDVFSNNPAKPLEPKRRLLLSMVSNQKFLDGGIITEWKKPFDMLVTVGEQKKKPQDWPGVSSIDVQWLPTKW